MQDQREFQSCIEYDFNIWCRIFYVVFYDCVLFYSAYLCRKVPFSVHLFHGSPYINSECYLWSIVGWERGYTYLCNVSSVIHLFTYELAMEKIRSESPGPNYPDFTNQWSRSRGALFALSGDPGRSAEGAHVAGASCRRPNFHILRKNSGFVGGAGTMGKESKIRRVRDSIQPMKIDSRGAGCGGCIRAHRLATSMPMIDETHPG